MIILLGYDSTACKKFFFYNHRPDSYFGFNIGKWILSITQPWKQDIALWKEGPKIWKKHNMHPKKPNVVCLHAHLVKDNLACWQLFYPFLKGGGCKVQHCRYQNSNGKNFEITIVQNLGICR